MKVESARYMEPNHGRIDLELIIDGHPAYLGYESLKPSLVSRGFVFLGAEWTDRIPAPQPPAGVNPDVDLGGFTTDPVIVRLAQDYLATVGKVPGPVPIPTREEAQRNPGSIPSYD